VILDAQALASGLDSTQNAIFKECVTLLINGKCPQAFSILAGAGSGKTRVAIAIACALLLLSNGECDVKVISFTRAAAGEAQQRMILRQIDEFLAGNGVNAKNLPATTMHAHAIEILAMLNPHVGGMSYYYKGEFSESSGDRSAALRLAASAMSVHGPDSACFKRLLPFLDDYGSVLPVSEFAASDFPKRAHDFMRSEIMSDTGLTAFANSDVADPDYMFSVGIDAMLRYIDKRNALLLSGKDLGDDGVPFGPGRRHPVLIVDETQDIAFLDLLYLKAAMIAGHHVVFVGDPRQTLFEFRKAVGAMVFDEKFMQAFLHGTGVKYRMANQTLGTNYRSRAGIIDLAENISELLVAEGDRLADVSKYIQPFPPQAMRAEPFMKKDLKAEKKASAVTFYSGGPDEGLHNTVPKLSKKELQKSGPRALANSRMRPEPSSPEPASAKKQASRKQTKRMDKKRLRALCGGLHGPQIRAHIIELGRRALKGESVAILARYVANTDDVRYVRSILRDAFGDNERFVIKKLSGNKEAPLSSYSYVNREGGITEGVPPSSVLVAAALHFAFSWDKVSSDALERQSLRPLSFMPIGDSLDDINSLLLKKVHEPLRAIEIELRPFLEALLHHADHFFPTDVNDEAEIQALSSVLARFTLDVMKRYALSLSRVKRVQISGMIPCRFHGMTVERDRTRNLSRVIPPGRSKISFQAFFRALVETPFALTGREMKVFESLGMEPELLKDRSCLQSLSEEVVLWKERAEYLDASLLLSLREGPDECVRARATIYDLFAQLFHRKTKKYTSVIARKLQKAMRADWDLPPEQIFLRLMVDGSHSEARNQAGVHTFRTQKGLDGLFRDLFVASHDMERPKVSSKDGPPEHGAVIKFVTIYSAKALEWDHCLLIFPEPSSLDIETSLKGMRDLLYVAITRARRTLGVVISPPKDKKDSETITSVRAAKNAVHQFAEKNKLFLKPIEWENLGPVTEDKVDQHKVRAETHHTELEKAQRCSMHHYLQLARALPSMAPMSEASYGFFFHATMASLASELAGLRMELVGDDMPEIARAVVKALAKRKKLGGSPLREIEKALHADLREAVLDQTRSHMEGLVPLHFSGSLERYESHVKYYAEAFLGQLAAISAGSELFEKIVQAKKAGGHKILIEKPLRALPSIGLDKDRTWLPIVGVPDIMIRGPKVQGVFDYKTLPSVDGKSSDESLLEVTNTMKAQMTLYQGLGAGGGAMPAEIIFVSDLTVLSWEEAPDQAPMVPRFAGHGDLEVVTGMNSAFLLKLPELDARVYDQTLNDIEELREKTEGYAVTIPAEAFEMQPLVGHRHARVSIEQCESCESRIHCHKRRRSDEAGPAGNSETKPKSTVIRRKKSNDISPVANA
jgi:superfamily I DNA/RNA helicase